MDMPTISWLKKEFDYGYDSGDVLAVFPNRIRRSEEKKIGGSYRKVFQRAVRPHLKQDSVVLELGPGNGSWSRAILKHIPHGRLITVDYQDVTDWLKPEVYEGRLVCHQVTDSTFSCIEDDSIDFFWSMGVLCHNNQAHIKDIMRNALRKLRPGGAACHQYADWNKLSDYGWDRGGVPSEFQSLDDDEIWWPRNSQEEMSRIAQNCGWQVESADLGLVDRDSIILLRRPVV
jgi:SAM-dependent methyltransferase